jgi:hypothetical protein
MTKDQTISFLTDAGNIATVEQIGEDYHRVSFKHRGRLLSVLTCEDDEVYLALQCSFSLKYTINDELEAFRALGKLQARIKVVKFAFEAGETRVTANTEQFMPPGDAFEGLFWRSVELVTRAAEYATDALDTTIAADAAAKKFIEELDDELSHGDRPHRDNDSHPLT